METKMNVLAVIPARGGSKEIPRMNIRLINGKPLVAYAIENALEARRALDAWNLKAKQGVIGSKALSRQA